MLRSVWFITTSIGLALFFGAFAHAQGTAKLPTPEQVTFFERKVRPVLAEACYQCHATSTKMALGGLQFDSRAGFLKGGNHGALVVPGQPDKSLLIRAVRYADRKLQMPPAGKLSEDKIADLVEWVKMGAPFPQGVSQAAKSVAFSVEQRKKQHWSWQPVKQVTVPKVKNSAWVQNPIDAFVLQKLEQNALKPASPAEKRTLIRRLTYNVLGLPPTPKEVADFLADSSPKAYEKVVDRLLASPHYGERWARHWLDLVRYAETDGHEFDFDKPDAYQYRDYVIRAFNADVPYNQFVMEHIAGDLLAKPRLHPKDQYNESMIGTGFWWLGEGKHSPVELLVDEAERIDNQIDVMSKTFVGLSLGCARCHDHKFDAISTKDFYALSGVLKSSRFDAANISNPDKNRQTIQELEQSNKNLQNALRRATLEAGSLEVQNLSARLIATLQTDGLKLVSNAAQSDLWKTYLTKTASKDPSNLFYPLAALADVKDPNEFARRFAELKSQLTTLQKKAENYQVFVDFAKSDYQGWFLTGEAFGTSPTPVQTFKAAPEGVGLDVVTAPAANSGSIAQKLEGTIRSKTFNIPKKQMWFLVSGKGSTINLIVNGFQRIRFPIYGGLTLGINSPTPVWMRMDLEKWVGNPAYLEGIDRGDGTLAIHKILFSDHTELPQQPNSVVLNLLEDSSITSINVLAERYQALLAETIQRVLADKPLQPQDTGILNWLFQNKNLLAISPLISDDNLKALATQHTALEGRLANPIRVMATQDGSAWNDKVHIRGSVRTLGAEVPRRTLEAFGGNQKVFDSQSSGRLTLAKNITSPTNPLFARVMVNRIWRNHFGEGIVRTPDDFGVMGEKPTHPELLDWLATEFIRQGWSVKKIHRLLLTSNTYRMSSRVSDRRAEEKDPTNYLLHRMPVRRLEAEAIRDGILAVSGRLDPKMYGVSILPNLNEYMQGRGRPSVSGPLDGDGRRSVYMSVRRNFLIPLLVAFDYPVPFTTIGRRTVSNVPAQALAMMNNRFVVQQAELWAKNTLALGEKTTEERIQLLYQTAFSRPPLPTEVEAAKAFIAAQEQPAGADNSRALAELCHVLLNTKEFIFIH